MVTTFTTSDFYLAAFLKARGLFIRELEREGRRSIFVFEDCAERPDLVREFYNGGTVCVNAFTHAIQDLKSVIHNW